MVFEIQTAFSAKIKRMYAVYILFGQLKTTNVLYLYCESSIISRTINSEMRKLHKFRGIF